MQSHAQIKCLSVIISGGPVLARGPPIAYPCHITNPPMWWMGQRMHRLHVHTSKHHRTMHRVECALVCQFHWLRRYSASSHPSSSWLLTWRRRLDHRNVVTKRFACTLPIIVALIVCAAPVPSFSCYRLDYAKKQPPINIEASSGPSLASVKILTLHMTLLSCPQMQNICKKK